MRSWVVMLVVFGAVTACQESTAEQDPADTYVLVLRDVLAGQPPPADPDVLPIVYVIGVGEDAIDATVQAEVAADLREEAEVRFADHRDEAVDADDDTVRDDGLLLAIGEVPAEPASEFEVEVEVYRSADDWSRLVLTLADSESELTVTSSSLVAGG